MGFGLRWRTRLLGAGVAVAALCGAGGAANAIYINDRAAAELGFGNIWDRDNALPATVAITLGQGKYCTGTLIDQRTIMTASHCLADAQTEISPAVAHFEIRFGTDAAQGTPHDRGVAGALIHPDYDSDIYAMSDIALLSLSGPVTGVAPVALALDEGQLPAFGDVAMIAGYGRAGTAGNERDIDFLRRVATMNYIGVDTSGSSPLILTQFRSPDDPSLYDRFGFTEAGIEVPYLQGSAAPGDSGGPIYIYRDGVYWQIGTVVGGWEAPPPDYNYRVPDYGIINLFTPVAAFADWLTSESAYRVTTRSSGDGVWSDMAGWRDQLGRQDIPDNVAGSFEGRGALGRYFGVRLLNPGTLTLDMDPVIDDLLVANAASRLSIGEGRTLTAMSGTFLDQGSIELAGRLQTGRFIAAGGRLGGTGTLATIDGVLNLGAVFVSGREPGSGGLRIEGDYAQGPNGVLIVPVGNAAANTFEVSGAASFDGTLFLSPGDELIDAGNNYRLITAGNLTGGFASVFADLEFLSPTLSATGTDLDATFLRNSVSLAQRADDDNQRAVVAALEAMDPGSTLFRSVLNSRAGTAGEVFSSLSAQVYADAGVSLLRQSMLMRDAASRKQERTPTPSPTGEEGAAPNGVTGWGMIQGLSGGLDDRSRAGTLSHNSFGVMGGVSIDHGNWNTGLVFGYSDASIGGNRPGFTSTAQTFHLGLEAGVDVAGFELSGIALHGWHDIAMDRGIPLPGLPQPVTASYGARTFQLYGEAARPISLGDAISLSPFAGIGWGNHSVNGFTDSAGAASLAISPGGFSDTIAALGLRGKATLHQSEDLKVSARGGIAGHIGVGSFSPTLQASFANGAAFQSAGLTSGRNTFAVNAGLDFDLQERAKLSLDYAGEFGSGRRDHSFQLRLGARF